MKDHRDYGSRASRTAHSRRAGRKIHVLGATAAVAFSVALAALVGQRLPAEAVSVLAGAACGVGATIPASLLVVWMVMRHRQEQATPERSQAGYPPVVVVQPPTMPQGSQYQPDYLPPYVSPRAQRQFTVVGGDSEESMR